MSKHTLRKNIVIAGVIVLLVATIAVGLLLYLQSRTQSDEGDSNRVGDSVALEDTPSLAACTIVTEEDLRAIMQNGVIEISEPERAGVIAPNANIADQCTFKFTTPKSDDNSITVQVFNVSAELGSEADLLDASWALDVDAELPTFFKEETVDGVKLAYLRVVNGGQIILWTLKQPNDQQQFNLIDQRYVVYNLSERADYAAVQAAAEEALDVETAN